jgi:SAM-dependent methyltransferase
VLIVGCGTGRDVIALARRGHRVVGVDPAPRAMAIARAACVRHGLTVDLIHGFFEDVDIPGRFDVVMFSYLCYAYMPLSSLRTQALAKARWLLSDGFSLTTSNTDHDVTQG